MVDEFYPFEIDVSEYAKWSMKLVTVHCQFAVSPTCPGVKTTIYKSIRITMENNDGKYICQGCSRFMKGSGRNAPACKYKTLDDNLMKNIDSEEKAYFLGWIASDGHVNKRFVAINIHKKDIKIIETLRDFFCKELPLVHMRDKYVGLKISSKQIAQDICRHLKIKPGNKSLTVAFPDLATDDLKWAFLRGLFDGDGYLSLLNETNNDRLCNIASISEGMKKSIQDFVAQFDIKSNKIAPKVITFSGPHSLNFLLGIYANANPNLVLERKFARYQLHVNWQSKKKAKATKLY